ncbi:MAG: gliding motility-associated C-terminal domain-containing protein [Flavobacteriales bacterium]|nr:gliding motility-associated C-terminal domain-containing protein [Flavobacteriales bacterium]
MLVTGLSAGTINVTTTDSNGCVSIDNCTIVDPTTTCGITLTPSILNPDSCGAGYGSASVNVTGSGTPYNYLWESGNTTTTENNLFGGANYITITDNGGCEEVFTIIIPGAGIDSMVVTSTPAACGVSDGSVLAIVYGGTSPYFYIWLNSNLDSIGTTNAMSNVPAGTYISGVRDVMGCNESGGNFVYNIGGPTLTGVSSTDVTCGNSSDGSVSVSVTGATPPYSYSWQEIDSGNQYSGQTVSGVPQGIYVVTISDSQNPACKMFAPVGVIGPEPIQSIYSPTQESCVGSSDGVIIPYTYGGVSPYTFVWSNGSTADSLVGISAGFYSVTITDVIGCQIVDTGSINILSNLTLLGSATQPNCGLNDGSISLSPSGGISGYSFFWSGGLTGPLQSGLSSGIYSVTVTDGIGCSDTISFTLLGVVPVSFVAYGYSDTCNAGVGAIKIDSVTGGTGTYEYSLDNINFQTTNEFTDLVADTFTVYVIDFGTCVSSTQVIISDTLFDVAVMFTISPDTLCPGDEVTITASGGNQFNWLTEVGTDNTITVFVDSSMYFPIEISLGNCLAIDSAHVIVLSERECWNSFVETPNAFSPDGDGTNDTWIIQGIEFTENTVIIFNRWGDTIGEFENYDNTSVVWNGTNTRGELLPTGTYFYVITIDGEITDKNWIQIVR